MDDCISEDTVVDLLEGRLHADEIDAITTHLDECSQCRELVADAARAIESVGSAPIARGTSVGRYLVLERVGAGSMGMVYAAYDPELNRRVALKLLRSDVFASAQPATVLRARLVREAQALAQLSHPNVITVYDVGTHEGEVFLAMELVEGGTTLSDWLEAEARTPTAILETFRQAGEGLAAAHAAGIVHRDFKPQNVLLGRDGRVRVSDFGLARATGDAPPPDRASGPQLTDTGTGTLVGTPAYMAPEQWEGKSTDARTDVFAFSVALYEALYGERPFAGKTPAELCAAVARGEIRPLSGSRVSKSIQRALEKGLRADPDERHASMQAMLDDLAPPKRRVQSIAMVLVAALAVLAALALRTPAAPPVCEGAVAAWGDVFDAAHQETVRRALIATNVPSADHAFAIVRRALEDYRSAWIVMHAEACKATRVRGEQSEALLDLRMQCLEERRRGALGLVRSIEAGGGADLIELSMTAAARLARVDDCADIRALSEPVPMPADPAKRARIVDLSGRAAEVESRAVACKEELAVLEPLAAEARELAWAPLTARLLYDRADRHRCLWMNREAEAELQEAAVLAQQARADTVALDAWIDLVYVVGYQEQRGEEGLLWSRYATAALTRTGGDPTSDRAERLHSNISYIYASDERRLDEARRELEQALEMTKKSHDAESLVVADAKGRLGNMMSVVARYDEALALDREVAALYERLVGPDNTRVAVTLGNEGDALLALGRVDEARDAFQRAQDVDVRCGQNGAFWSTRVGAALRAQGQPAAALEADRRALAAGEVHEPPDSYELSYAVVGIAVDLLLLGRPTEALPFSERAVKIRSAGQTMSQRGEARFARARALWRVGEKSRAREDAEGALADYQLTAERYGGLYRIAHAEIDGWLASHPK